MAGGIYCVFKKRELENKHFDFNLANSSVDGIAVDALVKHARHALRNLQFRSVYSRDLTALRRSCTLNSTGISGVLWSCHIYIYVND